MKDNQSKTRFKTGKLVIGIISIVLSFFILFQSCAVGTANVLMDNGSTSGSSGFILALCWLIGGIVGIAARKSKGGSNTAGGFYIVGGLMGIVNAGIFTDLKIWATLSFIFGIVFILSTILKPKST